MTLNPSSHLDERHGAAPVLSIAIPLRLVGTVIAALCLLALVALASWSVDDPSLSYATDKSPENWLGFPGAVFADLAFQFLGLATLVMLVPPLVWALSLIRRLPPAYMGLRMMGWLAGTAIATGFFACFPTPESWPLPLGLGGFAGNGFTGLFTLLLGQPPQGFGAVLLGGCLAPAVLGLIWLSARTRPPLEAELPAPAKRAARPGPRAIPEPEPAAGDDEDRAGFGALVLGYLAHTGYALQGFLKRVLTARRATPDPRESWKNADFEPQLDRAIAPPQTRREPGFAPAPQDRFEDDEDYADYEEPDDDDIARLIVEEHRPASPRVTAPAPRPAPSRRVPRSAGIAPARRRLCPAASTCCRACANQLPEHHPDALEENAKQLEGVLEDFGVKGDIINVRPGPVVTLYELEPAPGIKSSRVISLADDIARSMSAISARVAVVPGRNAIGIELPNKTRETVFLRELLASADYEKAKAKLPICLGKTIGGEPIIVDLARMPHLLIAGTTGSGKSVGINTMILSLLYKMTPEQCRLIMIDPKMLELSVYDGIPHLLTPVVTDPSKAVVALKWAVREMEDRYKKMSKVGVRNIDGFNARVAEAARKGEAITRTVQTGFDRETGEAIFESEEFDLEPLPYIVVIVDEMADLMMVAGRTSRRHPAAGPDGAPPASTSSWPPSAPRSTCHRHGQGQFPTRVSFQVTSKIDSRTILGEQGAEQLLGNGDMLYMAAAGV